MRRLLVAVLATLSLGVVAVPASADPLYRDYTHWNCPNGIQLNLGGGEGWRHWMRVVAWEWNTYIAPRYSNAPRITSITYWGGWDSYVVYRPCMIDMDEWWDVAGGWAYAGVSKWRGTNHIAGAAIYMESSAWWETARHGWRADFLRHYVAAHELHHAMGLGHNPWCDSVMSYCYHTLGHNGRDHHTLQLMYSHRH